MWEFRDFKRERRDNKERDGEREKEERVKDCRDDGFVEKER